jgi:hypothetical protein
VRAQNVLWAGVMRHLTLFALLASCLIACSGGDAVTPCGDPARSSESSEPEGGAAASADRTATDPEPPAPEEEEEQEEATGPVVLRNLTFVEKAFSRYSVTFSLKNESNESIERVQEITLRIGNGPEVSYAVSCQNKSWLLGGGRSSGVIELELDDNNNHSYLRPSLECGSVYGASLGAGGDTVELELRGLLHDATPWTARAAGKR